MNVKQLDPITERVLTNAFRSICEEMGHTMIRTANSSVFVEGRDFSCALVDPDAELIATANFDPSHLSAMALTVEYTILHFGRDTIRDGDVYLVNDPFRGGGHLPDITLIRPIFESDILIAFAVNRAHHIDVGGMAVAGFPGTAQSMFQEGIRIPPVRWYVAGEENHDIMEMISLNVRFPKDQVGDFRAQLASTRSAESRFLRLCDKYGADTVRACMMAAKDHSEGLMRSIIAELPDGVYEADELMEDDGVTDSAYRIHAALTIDGDHVTIDYTGTSPQAKGPINSSYGNTLSSTFNAMLQLAGPDVPFNHGCFRPISVTAPRGSLLNPIPPAPCFGGVTEGSIRIIDLVLRALSPIASDRVGAAGYGTCINFSGGGYDEERGQDFGFYFFCEGGWGATKWRDGWNCTPNPTSNFNDYPVEWVESTLPLRYKEARINTDSGGAGEYRGGVGVIRTVELLADNVEMNGLGERMIVPPYGIEDGYPGGLNKLLVRRAGESGWKTIPEAYGAVSPSKFNGHMAYTGDEFKIVTGGGGGFGNPLERDPERVAEDVNNGFVSLESAREIYGVVLEKCEAGIVIYDKEGSSTVRSDIEKRKLHLEDDYQVIFQAVCEMVVDDRVEPRVQAELQNVRRIIEQYWEECSGSGETSSGMPEGRSLDNPFLNDRAKEYWDSLALERWLVSYRSRRAEAHQYEN